MVDGVGTTAYTYDQVGQLLSEGGLWPNDTVNFAYANRLRNSLSVLAPNAPAWIQDYGYDNARRLTSLSSPAGTFGYIYDPVELQRVDQLNLPNGAVITNTFDNVARLLSTTLMNSSAAVLDAQNYGYNQASQRTSETNAAGDFRNYAYDSAGELTLAIGKELNGVTPRWQEQFGYGYDAAGNLNDRTNNTLVQVFGVNTLNELSALTNSGRLTVAGTTTSPATSVTVNTSNAVLYADTTFASTNQPWVSGNNTYTAIARDGYGRSSTNSISVSLQTTNGFSYDLNGNLLSDGTRNFKYDDENQLISVWPNTDPIGEVGGDNLFAFVRNNPVTEKDAFGLCPVPADCWSAYGIAQAQIKQNYLNCLFGAWGLTGTLYTITRTPLTPTGFLSAPTGCGAKAAKAQAQATGTYLGCLSGYAPATYPSSPPLPFIWP